MTASRPRDRRPSTPRKMARKRRLAGWRRFVVGALLAASLGVPAAYAVLRAPQLRVSTIVVTGARW
ncbi:MAG: hypothetical protein OXH04_00995, partial [Acidobacteria bacterium]|nr:hypothetical protein [Acidobacteriota bacterium]